MKQKDIKGDLMNGNTIITVFFLSVTKSIAHESLGPPKTNGFMLPWKTLQED